MVTERKSGELKNSLIFVFGMFALVISICLGVFNDRLLALGVIYSWGFGDAFAALIGTKFGKHRIYKKKSLEGSVAMFIVAFITVLTVLLCKGTICVYLYLTYTGITTIIKELKEKKI